MPIQGSLGVARGGAYIVCRVSVKPLVHTILVIMLVVLRIVMQEQLATFVHASKDYAK